MAHNPKNRHNLAPQPQPQPEPIPKPTVKRQTYPCATTTSTVYNLTNHLSKLNPNPTKSLKYPPTKHLDVHSQQSQAMSLSISKSAVLGKRAALESGKDGKKDEKIEKCKEEVVVVVGKRRSFSDAHAQVELGNFLVNNGAKVVAADMPPFIQIHAVGFARKIKDSLEKFTSKNLALSLKKEFDGVYGPAWHCIVGSSFGSFVTHSVGGFLYFSLDQKLYILLFKTTVQRAD